MAFDGVTVAAIVKELNDRLIDGRINKVAQPEKDELLLTVKAGGDQLRLILSANPTLPLVYLTDENKISPATAPSFTMLLRKHLQGGRIVSIYQPDFERIFVMEIEHLDEMGDVRRKRLITELMGKYSNIILIDEEDTILDSIRRVSALTSSVREVLPGLKYFIPRQEGRTDPCKVNAAEFADIMTRMSDRGEPSQIIAGSFTGISSMMAHEIYEAACKDNGIESAGGTTTAADPFTGNIAGQPSVDALWKAFSHVIERVERGDFDPQILYENGEPKDYCAVPVCTYTAENIRSYDNMSLLLRDFYSEKERISRSKQKTADLRMVVKTILERDVKKYDLQLKQLKDTEKMDKYKVYGELLHTYGYEVSEGDTSVTVDNYYTNEKLTIPLDPTLSAMDNAAKYFDRYNKLKRTKEALTELTVQVKAEIDHLESILSALDFASKEEDLNEIKQELIESGYVRGRGGRTAGNGRGSKGKGEKLRFKSKPMHYISSDGYHMYVGKNNYQNDELTFKVANGGDWWFHAKGMPGSHVIVKTEGDELPDRTFEEAARLAAHYSKGAGAGKVEIDYLRRKDVKKPNGAKPGYVIYYTNYSMAIDSDISGIQLVED